LKFTETQLQGAFIIDLEPISDHRGFFARAFCQRQFAAHGIEPPLAQFNISYNIHRGSWCG
jgi:dTDP-4-dehydrorhamnose 3,5-epimerase